MHLELTEYLKTDPGIALVGASTNPSKFGNKILRDLIHKNYRVVPVNPGAEMIENRKAYRSLTEIPARENVGLAVYVVPPSVTLKSLQEALDAGIRRAWIQPGAGDEKVRKFLIENEFDFLMNACVMVEAR